jgi:signal transduction histidine kinase
MFGTLHTRLIAAFAFVIFLSLTLAGGAFALLLAEYQSQREADRLQELALPIAYQVRTLQFQGASASDIDSFLERQASELGVRIAVLDGGGIVLYDTSREVTGMRIPIPTPAAESTRRVGRVFRGAFQSNRGETLYFAAPVRMPPSPLGERVEQSLQRQEPTYLAVLAPSASLQAALAELWPRLWLSALISLLVSVAVALFLSSSIARPLSRITRASEEIARGRYEQEIPVGGRDEVSRLAAAFNHMASEVARSHRAMRDLLANVSHDLRTPLTSVQGFSQAMLDGTLKDADAYAEAGRIINEESARMQRLVDDLLYLSRIESGQAAIERRPVALAEVVEACVSRAQRRADAADVHLGVNLASKPTVDGDGGRLEQVLDNLLDNALRHTPPGGFVTVRLEQTPVGGYAALSVRNTGSYIPPQELSRVFERFYQVDKARSGPSGRSGLGLAIAREIVEAHHGAITASSSREEGTTFRVQLPLTGSARPAETRARAEKPAFSPLHG